MEHSVYYLASTLPNAKLRSVAFANYESRKTSTMLTRLKLTQRAFHDSLSAGGRVLTDNGLLPRLEFIGAIGIGKHSYVDTTKNYLSQYSSIFTLVPRPELQLKGLLLSTHMSISLECRIQFR